MSAERATPPQAVAAPERSVRTAPMIVIAAGGTGGHFFPAEALAAELAARGCPIALMTDARSGGEQSAVFQGRPAFVLRGAGIAGRGPMRAAQGALALAAGTAQARAALQQLRPAVIVAFGGYPSVPPILASLLLRGRPKIILHEQNAVLGRANRALARIADHLALGMANTQRLPSGTPASVVGNPVRLAVQALSGAPYVPPEPSGPIHLLVTGGSLGARIFSDAVPAAIGLLPAALRARLRIVQQCRAEDLDRVRAAYAAQGLAAELAVFFPDMPARIAAAHFVIARAGAGTVAELAAIGRPALLVPLPGAIDGHQALNAAAVGALVLDQAAFQHAPAVLAAALAQRLDSPATLAAMAHAIAAHGRPRAASALADLVLGLADHHAPARKATP